MPAGLRSTVGRCVLLAALTLGVLGMHHAPLAAHDSTAGAGHAAAVLVADSGEATVGTGHPVPATPDPGHDVLHLCLAILLLATGLSLLLTGRVRDPVPPSVRPHRTCLPWTRNRSPGPAGRALLNSVCVLRV